MRSRLALLAATVLVGCGAEPPPDVATSRQLVTTTILDWHRLQAAGDGEAGCDLLTKRARARIVELDRDMVQAVNRVTGGDEKAGGSCAEVIAGRPARHSGRLEEALRNTVVDAVHVDGERATATAHTSVNLGGVLRATPPAQLPMRWSDGRWLID